MSVEGDRPKRADQSAPRPSAPRQSAPRQSARRKGETEAAAGHQGGEAPASFGEVGSEAPAPAVGAAAPAADSVSLEDVGRRLGPDGQRVLDVALKLGFGARKSRIHTPQLLQALYETDAQIHDAVSSTEAQPDTFRRVIAERSAQPERDGSGTEVSGLPPLSGHVAEGLAGAAAIAVQEDADEIGTRHLLAGMLGVASCSTVKALAADGLTAERILTALAKLLDLTTFSGSVRKVRERLGGSSQVTATQIAAGLQSLHPEYANGAFGKAKLNAREGRTATTDSWLQRVQALYASVDLRDTRHRVVDGELTLIGLAELDQPLAGQLGRSGVLGPLKANALARPRPERAERTEWAPDAPATTDELGRARLAEALADRLRRLAAPESAYRDSFIVHIDGPWGSGKSSLFEFLKTELRKNKTELRKNKTDLRAEFLVVEVNAWREQRVGVQWWTLLSALHRSLLLEAPGRLARARLHLSDLRDRIHAMWPQILAALFAVAAVSILIGAAGFSITTGGQYAQALVGIVAFGSVAAAGVVGVVGYLIPGSRRSAETMVARNANPNDEIRRLFRRALQRERRPTVFLIDDLDRCDIDYVVDFLEVVQTLVRDAPRSTPDASERSVHGPYAFVAADGEWIRTSYEQHYQKFITSAQTGRPLGYLFLEKVFQLRIRIPPMTPSASDRYLDWVLTQERTTEPGGPSDEEADIRQAIEIARSEDETLAAARRVTTIQDASTRMNLLGAAAVKLSQPEVEQHTEHELGRFARLLEPNPRSIKLFNNAYGVLRSLRTLQEIFVGLGPLALWTIVETRWPYLADQLRANPEAVTSRGRRALHEDVRQLLADPEVAAVLNDAVSGPLTPDLIRQCAGVPR